MSHSIDSRPTPWSNVILLCGKCARKMKGGYGETGKDTLRGSLRAHLKQAGYRRGVRIIETRCMGVCPKRAVTALNATRPGRFLTIPKGTATDAALAELLGTELLGTGPVGTELDQGDPGAS